MPNESAASAGARIGVILVDDHAILRQGLRALLDLDSELEVLGEAGNFEDALELAVRVMPHVVLTDIGLPGRSGLSLVTELRKRCPRARVVLLTAHASEEYVRAGMDVKPDGYVLKDSGHDELKAAIRAAASGQQYLCRAIANIAMAACRDRDVRGLTTTPLQSLTTRERQVLSCVASGQPNKAVARELSLSVKTVEKHRANMMRKLALHNAADITRFALNHHLVMHEGAQSLSARELYKLEHSPP